MRDDAAEMYRSLIHAPPGLDRVAALEVLLAAAEERGRRRGVEEECKRRDEPPNESDLLAKIAKLEAQVRGQQRCETCGGWWYEPWVLVCRCEAKRWHDAVLSEDAALAPREPNGLDDVPSIPAGTRCPICGSWDVHQHRYDEVLRHRARLLRKYEPGRGPAFPFDNGREAEHRADLDILWGALRKATAEIERLQLQRAALAPRDSAPQPMEGAPCGECGAVFGTHASWCHHWSTATYNPNSREPRDSAPAKMDASGGPRCWCGKTSRHESGWCGGLACQGGAPRDPGPADDYCGTCNSINGTHQSWCTAFKAPSALPRDEGKEGDSNPSLGTLLHGRNR